MRVLQVVSGLGGGGVSSLLYTYHSNLEQKIDMDFIVHVPHTGLFEPYFLETGSKVFHVVPASSNWVKHFLQINKVIKENHYDIIHVHQDVLGWPVMLLALLNGIKVRIAHSHLAYRKPKSWKRRVYTSFTKLLSTELWACGSEAGKNAWDGSDFYVLKNASQLEKFSFQDAARVKIRHEFDVHGEILVGMVGRFDNQKNHQFAVKVAKKLKERQLNFKFLFVGDGEKMEETKKQAMEIGCAEELLFAGLRDDVHDCLNAMDILIMPSLYEGLPVVMIESQANGLPIIVSDKVTKECAVLDNVVYLPIDDPKAWADYICDHDFSRVGFEEAERKLTEAGYNIHVQAKVLYNKYWDLIARSKKHKK